MIKTVSLECPSCGAPIHPADGESEVLCSYCGTKVVVHDSTKIHIVDEAEIIRAETEREESRHRIAMERRGNASQTRILRQSEMSAENVRIYSTLSRLRLISIAAILLSFLLAGVFGDAQDDFWAGVCIAGIIGTVAFSRMRKKRFTEDFVLKTELLTPADRQQLSLFRKLEYASIGCTLLSLIFSTPLQLLSDDLWAALVLAGIVGWVIFGRKLKKLVNGR